MPHIPASVAECDTSRMLTEIGYTRVHQGKVRDTFDPGDPSLLVTVATDRVSIFDFVLPCIIPQKGEVLTALTHFWLTSGVLKQIRHQLRNEATISTGSLIAKVPKPKNAHLARILVVSNLKYSSPAARGPVEKLLPYELIFRGHLGGSVYKDYWDQGKVAGQRLPVGLPKWAMLPGPLFTPSTKEETGHDRNITIQEFTDGLGGPDAGESVTDYYSGIYAQAYLYAFRRGIVLLDTKFEGGKSTVADEVLTPDCSRYTTVEEYWTAMREGRDPAFYDKQLVREWGYTVKTPFGLPLNKLDPTAEAHLDFVDSLTVPEEIVTETSLRYQEIFFKLTGMKLDCYQRERMGLAD
jgi:phosphoribosylaminoimidazole-succinocarboxamide synthase